MLSLEEGVKTCCQSLFEEAKAGWKAILDSAASHGDKAEVPLST